MELINLLYKIVGNPKSFQYYDELMQHFHQMNKLDIEAAIAHLIEVRNESNNSNPPEQERQA
jgi:hypothetical protein